MAKVAVLSDTTLIQRVDDPSGFPAGYFAFIADAREVVEEAAANRITAVLVPLAAITAPVLRLVSSQLRERAPNVALFGFAPIDAPDTVRNHHAHVAGVFFGSFDDVVSEIGTLIAPRDTSPIALVMRLVHNLVPSELHPLIELCLEGAREHPTVEQLARAAGIAHRTLTQRLTRAGLPDAREIVSWCRVLLAAHTIEHSGQSVARIADAHGFSSDASLRGMLRRRVDATPSELRTPGGFERALARFHVMLREAREKSSRGYTPDVGQ